MSAASSALLLPVPSDPVTIDIGDGVARPLRYTIGSIKRLSQQLGKPLMGARGGLLELDENLLPTLILEGLRDSEGKTDVTIEQLEAMPAAAYTYLLAKFREAYFGSLPQKKTAAALPSPAPSTEKPN